MADSSTQQPDVEKLNSQRFDDGFGLAVDQMQEYLDGMKENVTLARGTYQRQHDPETERFISETIAWAKQEMPTFQDAVDARKPAQPVAFRDLFTQGLTMLVLVKLNHWLESPDNKALMTEYERALDTLRDYEARFTETLAGTAISNEVELDMPPIARGLAALRHLMNARAIDEATEQREHEATALWAQAANMMAGALDGQPEADRTDLDLNDRFSLLLARLQRESEQLDVELSRDKPGDDN